MTAVASGAGGCALLFVSTDGLSGGAAAQPDQEGGDAATDGRSDGPLIDGGADTGTIDGATTDAGFCASNLGHTLCDDFDNRDDATLGWMTSRGGRGFVDTDSVRTRSAPHAFLAGTSAGPQIISYASIYRSVGTSNRLRLSFDVFVTPPPGSVGDSFASIQFAGEVYLDIIWLTGGGFLITERGGATRPEHPASKDIPASTWIRLQVETTPGRIIASVDGVTALDVATMRTYSGAAEVHLGMYSEDAFAIAFDYDNVLVDTSF